MHDDDDRKVESYSTARWKGACRPPSIVCSFLLKLLTQPDNQLLPLIIRRMHGWQISETESYPFAPLPLHHGLQAGPSIGDLPKNSAISDQIGTWLLTVSERDVFPGTHLCTRTALKGSRD